MSENTYTVLSLLGKGYFGTVHLCERKHNKAKIVVKEIVLSSDKDRLKAAKNEVNILKTLNHPNVVKYHDNFVKNNSFYILMEHAKHGNLYDYLRRVKKQLSFSNVLGMFCQILMGLNHIHQKKIIHRDLKTENIFLTGPSAAVVKIGDFGISKLLTTYDGKTNTAIGTTNYLAPEICDGLAYDRKSDIWSLGCILYELCSLQRLFQGSVTDIVFSIKSGNRKQIDVNKYGVDLQNIIDLTLDMNPTYRPDCIHIMAFPVIFPNLTMLIVNLGSIYVKS